MNLKLNPSSDKFQLFEKQLDELSRVNNRNLLKGYLIVKIDGTLGHTHLLNYLFEKIKGFFGGSDRTNKHLIELKVLQFLKVKRVFLHPTNVEQIKDLASRAGVVSLNEYHLKSDQSHEELRKLLGTMICEGSFSSKTEEELDDPTQTFYNKYIEGGKWVNKAGLIIGGVIVGLMIVHLWNTLYNHRDSIQNVMPLQVYRKLGDFRFREYVEMKAQNLQELTENVEKVAVVIAKHGNENLEDFGTSMNQGLNEALVNSRNFIATPRKLLGFCMIIAGFSVGVKSLQIRFCR